MLQLSTYPPFVASAASSSAPTSRVLLVDDDRAVRETTADLLTILGFDVTTAVNGEDAIAQLQRHAFDIIVTDIVMPKKDGYGLLEAVRANRSTRGIPVIMLSAKADKPDIRKGINEGADDYLTKPFDSSELVAAIKAQLKKRAARDQDAEELRMSIAKIIPHELRTPLTGILGFTEILAEMASDGRAVSNADITRACERIMQSGQHLNRLVERVTMWAELRTRPEQAKAAGHTSPAFAWVDAATISCQMAAAERARTRDLQLDLEPAVIAVPDPMLIELLSILAECGVELSGSGTPIVLRGRIEDGNYRVTLTHEGPAGLDQGGLDVNALDRLDLRAAGNQSLGLGLAIAYRLAEVFGTPPELSTVDRSHTLSLTLRLATDRAGKALPAGS